MHSLKSKQKVAAEKPRETHFLSLEEKEKLIEDYVERVNTGGRKPFKDAEAAFQQEQDDMTRAEITGLTSRESETTFEGMRRVIGDTLSQLASSDDRENREDKEYEETEQCTLSEDDEPGWVMGTITTTVQQRIERCWQEQMTLN